MGNRLKIFIIFILVAFIALGNFPTFVIAQGEPKEEDTYSLTFKHNYKENDADFENMPEDIIINVIKNRQILSKMPKKPIRSGYHFIKWSRKPSGSGTVSITKTTKLEKDDICYAIWEKITPPPSIEVLIEDGIPVAKIWGSEDYPLKIKDEIEIKYSDGFLRRIIMSVKADKVLSIPLIHAVGTNKEGYAPAGAVVTVTRKEFGNIHASEPSETVVPKTLAEKTKLNIPNKIIVENNKNLTEKEKELLKESIKKSNPDLPENIVITISEDGSAEITYSDKSTNTIPGIYLVIKKEDIEAEEPGEENLDEIVDNNDSEEPNNPVDEAENNNDLTEKPQNPKDKLDEIKEPSKNGKENSNEIEKILSNAQYSSIHTKLIISPKVTTLKSEQNLNLTEEENRPYIYGYPDGTFKPDDNVTRAEAAAMIVRLMKYDQFDRSESEFSDVITSWYNGIINAVVREGIMKGYEDGTFKPDLPITRGEFAKVIEPIDNRNYEKAPFDDVKNHWAESAINQGYCNNRLKGYPDGEFKPDNPITRAEAVTILNRLFDRKIENNESEYEYSKFTDLSPEHWAYYDIMEASGVF